MTAKHGAPVSRRSRGEIRTRPVFIIIPRNQHMVTGDDQPLIQQILFDSPSVKKNECIVFQL